ncbi:class E sortase [Zhihengliuella sp.]|uniref:class E sortase n=1 Tax=Zhihengliuella sp. TaxID=1954483 RepID=UPI002810A7FA|nr:class E sortase [Zhihengliuella sp.]
MADRTRGRRRRSPAARVAGLLGELLITLGVVLMLYVVWELWWTNLEAGRQQGQATSRLLEDFGDAAPAPEPTGRLLSPEEQAAADRAEFGEPPAAAGGEGTFALLYVPRFDDDYVRPVSTGVGLDVLNTVGIGHYPQTQLPGEPGNFALAGHRQTHGQVFYEIDQLTDGDRLYVQTREGFYQYEYSDTEIVNPGASEVLLPVPHQPDAEPEWNILTLTSCHPIFSTAQRIIAYAELESFRPAEAGPQDQIREAYAAADRGSASTG